MNLKRWTAMVAVSLMMCLGPGIAAAAGKKSAEALSKEAGSRGGVAASCGIDVGTFVQRIEILLKKVAANQEEAAKLIDNFKKIMAETKRSELANRTINCENARGEFAALAINKSGWSVDQEHGM